MGREAHVGGDHHGALALDFRGFPATGEDQERGREDADARAGSGHRVHGTRRLNIPEATPEKKLIRALPAIRPPARM